MRNVQPLEDADLKRSKLFELWNKKFKIAVEDEDGIAVMNGADRPKQCPYTMVCYRICCPGYHKILTFVV